MSKPKKWPAWKDGGARPKGWAPESPPALDGVTPQVRQLSKLRKLVTECQQNGDGRYHLPGTTFSMTIAPELERKLWG